VSAEPINATATGAGEGGSELVVGRPAARLGATVLRYAGWREESGDTGWQREVPSGGVVLLVGLGPALEIATPGATSTVTTPSFVGGVHTGPAFTRHGGRALGVQIDLSPIAAHSLLGVPMHELANRVVPFGDILGRRFDRLVDRLQATDGWAARFALIDEVLVDAVATGPPPSPEILWVHHQLVRSKGTSPIGGFAETLDWSPARLATRFRHEVGVSPKAFARVLRFRAAVDLLTAPTGSPPPSLADVAVRCGYYDQPHLNREFRALAGCTPGQMLAGDAPMERDAAGSPARKSVQDVAPASVVRLTS
jgi:AraC-like DNA-binding protein